MPADGSSHYILGDEQKCKAIIKILHKGIDWDCGVRSLFREENLVCRVAVQEVIKLFFESVEQGIILEDDCLTHASFFRDCETLLEKYKEDESVYVISGASLKLNFRI